MTRRVVSPRLLSGSAVGRDLAVAADCLGGLILGALGVCRPRGTIASNRLLTHVTVGGLGARRCCYLISNVVFSGKTSRAWRGIALAASPYCATAWLTASWRPSRAQWQCERRDPSKLRKVTGRVRTVCEACLRPQWKEACRSCVKVDEQRFLRWRSGCWASDGQAPVRCSLSSPCDSAR